MSCTCHYVHILGKDSKRSPSCSKHTLNAQSPIFLLLWALCQLWMQEKERKDYFCLNSTMWECQNLVRHFVSSAAFHACCHLPSEPNGKLRWMECLLLLFQFPFLLFISLASQELFWGPIASCRPGKAMRPNSFSGWKHIHYHKKNTGKGTGDLLSKGWWHSWDCELPEVLQWIFVSRVVLDLISVKTRASEFLQWLYCNLNLHVLYQPECFLWILNRSLFEKMQMIVLGCVASSSL